MPTIPNPPYHTRDHNTVAWLEWFRTHNHPIKAKYVPPASMSVTNGTLSAGTVTDLANRGGTTVVVTELAATPGFKVEFTFNNVIDPVGVVLEGWYQGNIAHTVTLSVWNYTTSAWDDYTTLITNTVLQRYSILLMLSSDYVSLKESKLQILHSTPGSAGHTLNLDYVAMLSLQTY